MSWRQQQQYLEEQQWLADRAAQAEYQAWLDTLDKERHDMPRTSEMMESKFLKKEDVGEDGTIVTVAGIGKENVGREGEAPEYRWIMSFEEFEKPMVLNSTNIKLAEKALGSDDTDDWVGKKIIVYNDPNVSFGKEIVGGIRVRAYRKAGPPRQVGKARQVESQGVDPDDAPF